MAVNCLRGSLRGGVNVESDDVRGDVTGASKWARRHMLVWNFEFDRGIRKE